MAAQAGPVGAFADFKNGVWPASVTTQAQAWALWESQTGTAAQSCKIFYFQLSQFPQAMDYQTTAAANLGIKAVVCVKPDYSSQSSMAADLVSFTSMVNMFQAHGLTGQIVLWQEPQNTGKTPVNPTAAQYKALLQYDPNGTGIGAYHAAANAAGFGLVYDAASHTPSAWATYFPGAAYLDAVAVDYYCDTYVSGIRIHGTGSIMDIADQAGLPFGIFEIGVTPGSSVQPSQAQMANYLAYLTQIMGWNAAGTVNGESLPAGRLHQGLANAPVMWWNGVATQTYNQVVPLATATYAQASYCVNTGYPGLWQALQPQSAPTLTITTTSLPGGTQGTAYSQALQATGGTTPYTWSVSAGSLPAGLTLHASTGVIDGTPTGTGTSSFTVKVADSASHTDTQALSITVGTATQPLSITTSSLPPAVLNSAYSAALVPSGGTPPYAWSHTGALPPGLTLRSDGSLTGTPTAVGTYSPAFTVTDSASATVSATLPVTVTAPAPVRASDAIPGLAQPGTFTPGLQGTASPLEPAYTTAVPGQATPGAFTPGDPGTASLPMGAPFTPATPGQAQPGLFTPADPGAAIAAPAGDPYVVQQVSAAFTYNYGWSSTEFSGNQAGNMLVVVAGWDVNATAPAAPMPAAYVCDSATNRWYHAGTTTAGNTGSRCTVWACPNASPVDWVSCSLTGFASSLAYTIIEVGNAPQFFSIDVQASVSDTGNTKIAASPGRTGSAAIGLSVLAAGSAGAGLTGAPGGWASLGSTQAGAGQPNGVTVWPFWQPSVPAGTSASTTYTLAAPAPLSAVTVMIEASPNPPMPAADGLPVRKVEAGFGFLPGDPAQTPLIDWAGPGGWTDITPRCIVKDGSPYIQPAMGRAYELATPEAGELLISCDNHDGAFTPGNPDSPFPGLALGMPIRVTAYWAGTWYPVAFGYLERAPQEWPDMPQWGMSAMVITDAFSVLSAAVSHSALNGDMLLDAPYVLIPCSEQYTTQSNSLTPLRTPSPCQGLLAANISRINQRPGTYVDGTGAQCATGQSTTLLGSQDTGFGCSSFTAPLTATSSGPGMIYWDPALPGPLSPSGLSVEFWPTLTAAAASANVQPTVLTAFAAASNYQTSHPALQVQAQTFTGNNLLAITFADGTSMTVPFSPSPNPQQVVLVWGALGSFGATGITCYVNGALAGSGALTAAQAATWQALMLGCGNYAYHCGTLTGGAFTASGLAIYPYQLPLQRIVSHYVTGVSGQQGVSATTRIAQVLAWANLGIPRGGQVTFGGAQPPVAQGPAYSLSGANVSAAVNQAAANEQAMVFCAPDGTLRFTHRWGLFNQAPAVTFGDNPSLGEIPFLAGMALDYDNSYLYNIDQVTQVEGPTTGITVTNVDTSSQASYFPRSIQQFQIQTTSNLDAYDLANQAIAAYAQPSLRIKGLTVDAAANPGAAFPGVLSLQQSNAALVNRRPVGGAAISAPVIVQKVSHDIGPGMWRTSFEMSPYVTLANVLQLDAPIFNIVGSNNLP